MPDDVFKETPDGVVALSDADRVEELLAGSGTELAEIKAEAIAATAAANAATTLADQASGAATAAAAAIVGKIANTEGVQRTFPIVASGDEPDDIVALWLDRLLRLEGLGIGPGMLRHIGVGLQIDTALYGARRLPVIYDEVRAYAWLDRAAFDVAAFGPRAQALIRSISGNGTPATLVHTDGLNLRRMRADIGHLAGASVPTIAHHLWQAGDSWVERTGIPQAIVDDMIAMGVPIVASGHLGLGSPQQGAANASYTYLSDGTTTATATIQRATVADAQEQGTADGGQYSPDGFRATWAANDTAAGATWVWKGKRLTFYRKANGASFSHATDGGAAVPVTATGTGTGKTTITAATEGWHTTTISRPTATGDLEWYGAFAASDLPGLTVSKAGNGGSTMAHVAGAIVTAASRYILADIFAQTPRCTLRAQWLTNESRTGASVSVAAAAWQTILTEYRAAAPDIEALFSVPLRNGQAGINTGTLDIGDYLPGILGVCEAMGADFYSHYALSPPAARVPHLWDAATGSPPNLNGQLHLDPDGGGMEMVAADERRTFWETN